MSTSTKWKARWASLLATGASSSSSSDLVISWYDIRGFLRVVTMIAMIVTQPVRGERYSQGNQRV